MLPILLFIFCCEAYRQEQKGKKEAAADRKKKVQAASLPTSDQSKGVADGQSSDSVPLTMHPLVSNEDVHMHTN